MSYNKLREEFAKAYPDDNTRFALYQDLEIRALKAMILISEQEKKEYERILSALIEDNLRIKNLKS